MSDDQNVYQQIGKLIRKQIADKEKLNELTQVKRRKLAECERQTVEAMKDYLSSSEPIWNRMYQDSNKLLALENSSINSATPILDAFKDLKVYLDLKFSEMDRKFTDLDRKLDSKFANLYSMLDSSFADLDKKLDRNFSEMKLQLFQLRNMNLNKQGEYVIAIPFLDSTWPEEHNLPEIKTASDIDALTRDHCREYLTGYGISFREDETISLKEKLRDMIGFLFVKDMVYTFHGFGTE